MIQITEYDIDRALLRKFLGHILTSYKAADVDHETAVNKIAFLVEALVLPGEQRASLATEYMQLVLERDGAGRREE